MTHRIKWLIAVFALALTAPAPVGAASVCVEEVGGVCLKFEQRSEPKPQAVASPAQRDERRLGLTRSERRDVQEALRGEGFYDGSIDGALGPQSRRAIARWQGSRGEAGTGFLSAEQFSVLRDLRRQPAVVETPAPAPQPAPQPAAPAPEPEPVIVKEEPKELPHPQPGRVYREARNNPVGSHVTMEVERVDDANVKITLTVKSDRTMKKSCIAPINGPVDCYMRQQKWNMIYVSGQLPRLSATESEVRFQTPFRMSKETFVFW